MIRRQSYAVITAILVGTLAATTEAHPGHTHVTEATSLTFSNGLVHTFASVGYPLGLLLVATILGLAPLKNRWVMVGVVAMALIHSLLHTGLAGTLGGFALGIATSTGLTCAAGVLLARISHALIRRQRDSSVGRELA